MTEQKVRDQLHEALMTDLVRPLIPVVRKALEDMLGTQKKSARDMKAAYLIAEIGRDLVLKGPDSRDAETRKKEIMAVVREALADRKPPTEEEPAPDYFAQIERERNEADGSGAGIQPSPGD